MDSLDFSFNTIDIIIVIPLLWFGYKGLRNGLIIEAASLIALLIGIYGAYIFSGFTADFLIKNLNLETDYIGLVSFALTFIVIVIVVHLFAKLIKKFVSALSLGIFDKISGLIFSIAKWAFILSVLLGIINRFDSQEIIITKDLKNNSMLYNPITDFAPKVFPYLHLDDFKALGEKAKEQAKEDVKEKAKEETTTLK